MMAWQSLDCGQAYQAHDKEELFFLKALKPKKLLTIPDVKPPSTTTRAETKAVECTVISNLLDVDYCISK